MSDESTKAPAQKTYQDNDFVYVDPEAKVAVGLVEWTKDGVPISKERVEKELPVEDGKRRRKRKKRNYPWGRYGTMKKIFNLEGKMKQQDGALKLDVAISKAMDEPFWD